MLHHRLCSSALTHLPKGRRPDRQRSSSSHRPHPPVRQRSAHHRPRPPCPPRPGVPRKSSPRAAAFHTAVRTLQIPALRPTAAAQPPQPTANVNHPAEPQAPLLPLPLLLPHIVAGGHVRWPRLAVVGRIADDDDDDGPPATGPDNLLWPPPPPVAGGQQQLAVD